MSRFCFLEKVPADLLSLVKDKDAFVEGISNGTIKSTSKVGFICQLCGCTVMKELRTVFTGAQGVKVKPFCRKCCYHSDAFHFERIGNAKGAKRTYHDELVSSIEDIDVRDDVVHGKILSTQKVSFVCKECGKPFERSLGKAVKMQRGLFCDACNVLYGKEQRCDVKRRGKCLKWDSFTKDFLDSVYDVDDLKRLYDKQELTSRSKISFRCVDCGEPCVHDILHYWNAQSGWKRQPRCEQCKKKTAKVRLLETINENKVYDADLVSLIPDDCPEKPLFAQKKVDCETVLHIPCASCKTPLEIKWRYVTRDKKFLCKQCQGLEYSRMMRRKFIDKYPAIESVIVDMDKFLSGDDERNGMETMIQCRCQKCGNAFERSWLSLKNCAENNRNVFCDNCLHHTSSLENEMCAFLDSLNVNYERRKHLFVDDKSSWFEVDVFIPEKNLAIEMNGSYWHATLGRNQIATKAKDYHMKKFLMCKDMGIRLLSIFDYDWLTKPDKVKRIIRDALVERERIYARQCNVRQATNKECAVFFADNHFDGHASNASFFVVLEHNGSIVAAMSFGHPRGVSIDEKSKTNETNGKGKSIEMYRYATQEGITVVGGVSRCLSFALKQINRNGGEVASIVTYSDNNLFTGDVYKRLGFEQQRMTEEYFWSDLGETFLPRYATQKSKLCNLFRDVTTKDIKTKTENDIMVEHGFVKVYTAGNTRWVKNVNVKET